MPAVTQHQDDTLTGRQKECLLLLKGGLSSKQIARELNISPRTVDQHIAVALENLGIKNRLEAISRLHEMERPEADETTDPSPTAGKDAPQEELREPPVPPDQSATLGEMERGSLPVFPPIGGSSNTASVKSRIAWMARLATFCSMLTCLVLLFILGLSEIVSNAPR